MASASVPFNPAQLGQWRLLEAFRQALRQTPLPAAQRHPSFADPRRTLSYDYYLCLLLFGLFNPVVRTLQALCAATELARVQHELGGPRVSLGSFSETQHLIHLPHLQAVFAQLVGQIQGPPPPDPQHAWTQWFARDSSLFAALPRMTWALYGGGHAGGANTAVRLHLNFQVLEDKPALAEVTIGKECERRSWKRQWQAGAGYIGDRYFSKDYRLFGLLNRRGCRYVIRLIEEATINIEAELPVTEADRAEGVIRQAWVTLGKGEAQSVRLRAVWIEGEHSALILITNLPPERLSAQDVSLLYRRRWQIECYFRWLKCLLGCRHWLAESPEGVTIQLYLALIASVLLQVYLGQRPNRRIMELLQFYHLGWASLEELVAGLQREQQRQARRHKARR